MKSITFTTLTLLLLAIACSSPKKKFDNGDYSAAFKSALKNLKNEKKATEADRDILLRSLDKIYQQDQKDVSFYENSAGVDNLEKAFNIQQDLLDKIEKANPYLGDKFAFNYQQAIEREQLLSQDLMDEFMQLGEEHLAASMENGNKFLAQDAYKYLDKAEKYGAVPSVVDSLHQLCFQYGTLVYRVSAYAPFNLSFNWEIDNLFANVSGDYPFRTVVYEENIDYVDCDIEIRFRSLDINESRNTNTQNFEEAVVTGYETVTDTSGFTSQREIRTNVEGSVTTTQINKRAQWYADINVSGYSDNCRLSGNTWFFEVTSTDETVELNGDRRAIPGTYQPSTIINLASDDDLAKDLLQDIYNQFRQVYF